MPLSLTMPEYLRQLLPMHMSLLGLCSRHQQAPAWPLSMLGNRATYPFSERKLVKRRVSAPKVGSTMMPDVNTEYYAAGRRLQRRAEDTLKISYCPVIVFSQPCSIFVVRKQKISFIIVIRRTNQYLQLVFIHLHLFHIGMAQPVCYWPNRSSVNSSIPPGFWPCHDAPSPCCREGEACLSNGLCYDPRYDQVRAINHYSQLLFKRIT